MSMSERLTPDQERFLLGLARRSIEHYFETGEHLQAPAKEAWLKEKRGAFVTLKAGEELRGCVGYPLPYKPLAETVIEMAAAAASQDFRFNPLTPEELAGTRIEISVLSLPEPVKDPKEVEVGRHGIIVAKGGRRGLLLPQVPIEQKWDRETFLRHGCLKAGLGPDEWKKGAKIEVFTAQVFSE
jgi:AmmeMemoRadiSam system protein A